ncbi:MAG: hypothetical protein DMF73_00170 [Acidobacteria bacterium]|nr:MAG: hypothetical protein DMF73_00170 [Acidobacteriota bacterium]
MVRFDHLDSTALPRIHTKKDCCPISPIEHARNAYCVFPVNDANKIAIESIESRRTAAASG